MISIYQLNYGFRKRMFVRGSILKAEKILETGKGDLRSLWNPSPVSLHDKQHPWLDNIGRICAPIFSMRVKNRLGHILDKFGQFLPLPGTNNYYYFYYVTHSILSYCDDTQYHYGHDIVEKFSFNAEALTNEYIYKEIAQKSAVSYVTNRFVDAVIEAELTGFVFRRIWSEEQGSIAPDDPPWRNNNEPHRYVGSVEIIN